MLVLCSGPGWPVIDLLYYWSIMALVLLLFAPVVVVLYVRLDDWVMRRIRGRK